MHFIPYGRQHIDEDDISSVVSALKSELITTGPKIDEFERLLAKYFGVKYVVCTSSATAALHISSLYLLKDKDKVITTPNSFIATSNAILYAKAKPIFVDIQQDGNIDLDLCEEMIKSDNSIKALFVVAISGNMINQKRLKELKDRYNIIILEDCSHAIGAKYDGIKAGSCFASDCAIFSFHPVKHITTLEGGAIATNSKDMYEELKLLRNHGQYRKDKHSYNQMIKLGFNYRISDVACALGISQLKKLDIFVQKRVNIAKKYDTAFLGSNIAPLYPFNPDSSYHLYIVKIDFKKLTITKKELLKKLLDKNIGTQIHYKPINKEPYYLDIGYGKENTPNMDSYYNKAFSLPIYPTLTDKEQTYIIESILQLI